MMEDYLQLHKTVERVEDYLQIHKTIERMAAVDLSFHKYAPQKIVMY
jgi:hypothetical protein